MKSRQHNTDMTSRLEFPPRRLMAVDEADITFTLKKALEQSGFSLDVFNDPVLALSNFKPNFYSLSILDINMPKMNGYELYKEIRKLDNKVKVCFLTASEVYDESLGTPPPEMLRHAKYFISKPLDL